MREWYLTKKVGSKKYAVAGIVLDDHSCAANASSAFHAAGFPSIWHKGYGVERATILENQKIFHGKAPVYQQI